MPKRSKRSSQDRLGSLLGKRERYTTSWRENFFDQFTPFLGKGITILDVGSGRTPAIPVGQRPEGCRYIGLDISAEELALAPVDSYDERFVRDLRVHDPKLDEHIDLAISWQVLEHINPLGDAMANVHAYLKPGGHFVALLSGRNAHFALINRIIPEKLGVPAMKHLLHRRPDSVFRAHYDNCTYSGLSALLREWNDIDIVPLYRGVGYFRFSEALSKMYLIYEDWAVRSNKKDLATHYIVVATK